MNGTTTNQGKFAFLEDQLAAACAGNGAVFAAEYTSMNKCDVAVVVAGARLFVKRAAELGLLTAEELETTRYMAEKRKAEEEARRKALAEEKERLRKELADIDEGDLADA